MRISAYVVDYGKKADAMSSFTDLFRQNFSLFDIVTVHPRHIDDGNLFVCRGDIAVKSETRAIRQRNCAGCARLLHGCRHHGGPVLSSLVSA